MHVPVAAIVSAETYSSSPLLSLHPYPESKMKAYDLDLRHRRGIDQAKMDLAMVARSSESDIFEGEEPSIFPSEITL